MQSEMHKTAAWLTDLHFDFIGEEEYAYFIKQVLSQKPDLVILSGDLAVSPSLIQWLERLLEDVSAPLYFVLGNHDYYKSSFESVNERVRDFCKKHPRAHWLTEEEVIPLTENTALIGHDAWADGQEGDFWNSRVNLNDYRLIIDFIGLEKGQRLDLITKKGKDAAKILKTRLDKALQNFPEVVMVIHPPPFRECSRYEDHPADDDWAPHFVCKAAGEMIQEVMTQHPEKKLLVLCGHSHHWADYQPLPNVRVLTGHAEYGNPKPQPPLHIT